MESIDIVVAVVIVILKCNWQEIYEIIPAFQIKNSPLMPSRISHCLPTHAKIFEGGAVTMDWY
jgi:hypothetical protein